MLAILPLDMRWTSTLCLALLTVPALASAQIEEDEEVEMAADDPAPDDTAPDDPALGSEPPPPPPEGTGTTRTETGPQAPRNASASVVVDERAAELRREQEAMVAEHTEGTDQDEAEQEESESLDHEFQLGIRAGAGVPFFFGLRYTGGPRCDDSATADPNTFCLGVGSGIIDFDLSFGVSTDVEIVALGRIGMIGVEPTEERNIQVGLGIRAYISPESLFKVYLTTAAILDLTPSGGEADWGDADFGVRGGFGLQLDFVRYVGLWVELGMNILFLRSFGIGPYASGGFQVRVP